MRPGDMNADDFMQWLQTASVADLEAFGRGQTQAVRFTEGPTARNNAGPGPTTPKPAIVPRPQPRRGRFQP